LSLLRAPIYWHDEPNILSAASAYLGGQPLYVPPTAPALYSLLYGPYTFLIYVPILILFSDPLRAINCFIVAVNLINLALLYRICRHFVSPSVALGLLPVAIGSLLVFVSLVLGLHADRWLLFCCTGALLCTLSPLPGRLGGLLSALLCGFFSGAAVNFKLTLLPIALLLLIMVYRRSRFGSLVTAGIAFIGVLIAPFFLAGVSLRNYLLWLGLARQSGISGPTLFDNVLVAVYLVIPGLLLMTVASRDKWRIGGVVVPIVSGLALVTCVVTGSKAGAGAWHLWPMLPFLLAWYAYEAGDGGAGAAVAGSSSRRGPAEASRRGWAVLAAIAIGSTTVTVRYAVRDFRVVVPRGESNEVASQRAAEHDLIAILRRYPNRNIAMGYGTYADDYRSNLRFLLPLHGEMVFLDENGIVEHSFDRLPLPPALVTRILGCKDIWLIPHGETPFSTQFPGASPGYSAPPLFPDSIRLHFSEMHSLVESGRYYDVWGCNG
jgi:hypothetical protein